MSERVTTQLRPVVFRDLGILEYSLVLDLQSAVRNRKVEDPDAEDELLFVEHPPVFTFGKNGGQENLMVSDAFLAENGVTTAQTDRGGNITYHGPGQAVLYPVINLERARIGVSDFVTGLEQVMIDTAQCLGVSATRDARNHGVWVGKSKIGSVGLSIKKGISMHGIALNICPDLTPFSWINPCGMEQVSITSVEKERSGDDTRTDAVLLMDTAKKELAASFCRIFEFSPVPL